MASPSASPPLAHHAPPLDRDALLQRYADDVTLQGLTPKTVLNYRTDIHVFLRHPSVVDVLAVEVPELRAFLHHLRTERKLDPKTIGRYFSALQSFYQYLEFEQLVTVSPVKRFRARYLKTILKEAKKQRTGLRQLASIQQAKDLAHSILDPQDLALIVLLFKTGIRREEVAKIDVEDIDWKDQSIRLKMFAKRTNPIVFFDDETERALRRHLAVRATRWGETTGPLFLNAYGKRLSGKAIYERFIEVAQRAGLHRPGGTLKEKYTPHCCRHWFTTHLRGAGMKREHVSWLRGDAPIATMDIYNHIDPQVVRAEYLACIPQLGLA